MFLLIYVNLSSGQSIRYQLNINMCLSLARALSLCVYIKNYIIFCEADALPQQPTMEITIRTLDKAYKIKRPNSIKSCEV